MTSTDSSTGNGRDLVSSSKAHWHHHHNALRVRLTGNTGKSQAGSRRHRHGDSHTHKGVFIGSIEAGGRGIMSGKPPPGKSNFSSISTEGVSESGGFMPRHGSLG